MASNPYQPGTTEYDVWNSANPPPGGAGTPTAEAPGAPAPAGPQDPLFADRAAAAADRAVYAFLAKRRFEEIELPEFALKSETERARMRRDDALAVWKQAYERSQLGGYMPGAGAGTGQAVLDAIGALRTNAAYQAADGPTKRMMEAASVAQATGIDTASATAAIDRMRELTAQTGQPSSADLVERVLAAATGGVPTLEREQEQNRTTIDTLRLLSSLRGPENAFAYASTIANLPPSIRANIQAAMGRLPFTGMNPAQRGVMGDIGVPAFGQQPGMVYAQQQGALPGGQAQYALPAATGPRTAQSYLPAPQAAMGQQSAALAGGGQTVAGGGTAPPATPMTAPTTPAGLAAQQAASQFLGQQSGMVTAQQPMYGPRTTPAQQAGMTAPQQLSPTDWNRTDPYGKALYWAGLEYAGEDLNSAKWRYENQLPRAYGPRQGTYRAA